MKGIRFNGKNVFLMTVFFALCFLLLPNTIAEGVSVTDGAMDVSNNLNVNSNAFFVDSAGKKVGIGTNSPKESLDVKGNSLVSGKLGVGTLSPRYQLEVYNGGAYSSGGKFGFYGSGTSYGVYGVNQNTKSNGFLGYGRYGGYFRGSGNYGLVALDGDNNCRTHLCYSDYGLYTNNKAFIKDRLGIGASPSFKLEVRESRNSFISRFYNTMNHKSASGILIRLGTLKPGSGNYFLDFRNSKNKRVGSVRGNARGGVIFGTTSDRRLKTNIQDFEGGLDLIKDITPVSFEYIGMDGGENIGFIAQELKEVYPWAVSGEPDDDFNTNPMTVDYGKVTPLLVSAVKEQQEIIEKQSNEINALKESICRINPLEDFC